MMRTGKEREEGSHRLSDRLLWQRGRVTEMPEDDALRFLDFAAFADGLLDTDERDRVAALLAADPDAAADVAAAQSVGGIDEMPAGFEHIVQRACAIAPDAKAARGVVSAFTPQPKRRRIVYDFAQWGSIAAALAVASWLGFSMGTDASLALTEPRQPGEATLLPELFDPPTGLLRDLGEGLRT